MISFVLRTGCNCAQTVSTSYLHAFPFRSGMRSHAGQACNAHGKPSVLQASGAWEDLPELNQQLAGALVTEQPEENASNFDAAAFSRALTTASLGRRILTAAELQSTQTLLQENRMHLPSGTLCIADRQVGGKGRSGNVWTSPPGCLMFSLLFDADIPGPKVPFIQYVACIAVVAAAQRLFSERLGITANPSTFPLRIKWPNDIYALPRGAVGGVRASDGAAAPLKIGGILCQSCYVRQRFSVLVGVGLNLNNAEPTTCINAVLQACAQDLGAAAQPITRPELLAEFVNSFEPLMETLERDGFEALRGTYQRYWMHENQQVMLQDPQNALHQVPIRIVGISETGYLKGVDESGNPCELHPDGNSFDMMQGLIKRKLST